MLRPGDPVNVGERCHLIVKLADVPARNMEVSSRNQEVHSFIFLHGGKSQAIKLCCNGRRSFRRSPLSLVGEDPMSNKEL